MYLQCI